MRESSPSSTLLASMLRVHEGSWPLAATAPKIAAKVKKVARAARRMRGDDESRKYFNAHLLRSNVVGNILGGYGQFVSAGNGLLGNSERTGVGGGVGIPVQRDGHGTVQARDQGASTFRRADFQIDGLAALETLAIEFDLHDRRLASDDKRLRLAVGVANFVAQDETHGVRTILHVGGREKARLPDIFLREIAKRLHESERKERDNRHHRFVGFDAQNRVAGTNDAGAEQGAWHSQKRRVGSHEFVLAGEANKLIDRSLVFTLPFNLFEQGIHAGAGPQSWQLGMIGRFARQTGLARYL